MIIGADLEWDTAHIDVLGLAWDTKATATARDDQTLAQYLDILKRADVIVGQNFLDADCRQLAKEGIDVSWLEPKVYDIRLAMHVVNGHLAGTGSYDLRSIVLLLGGKQGQRFPLEWKQYASDLHKTCAFDSAAALYCHSTLDRFVKHGKLDDTLHISHQCASIFARMREQGVQLDKVVLEQIYTARKAKTEEIIERYHLWEERGKKVIKKVPIWRSNKVLDICEQQFGFRPKDRKRATWLKLAGNNLTPEAREFVDAIIDLGKGANDAHWLGKAEETESGELDFDKVGDDGLIHPRYDICGSPDRSIASGPNIQNFPRPSDDPRPVKLRSAVVPLQEGHVILGIDFCVHPDTKVLCADLLWKNANLLQNGDELIGFDEQFDGRKTCFRRASVEHITTVKQPCYKIMTDRGTVISSGLHKWLSKDVRTHGLKNYGWCQTDQLRVGSLLKFFNEPWVPLSTYEAGKLTGFLDGKGYVNASCVAFGQNEGDTLQEYLDLFAQVGFNLSLYARQPYVGLNGITNQFKYGFVGGRYESLRLLGMLRPQRLLKKHTKLWENRGVSSKRTVPAIVLRIEYIGEQEVIGIQTNTKTFIANGFFSHNSSVETITNAIESNDWDRVQATLDKRITHEGTAKIINDAFGLNLNRTQGKNINHGFDKGESPYNLARTLFKTDRPSRQQVLQCQQVSSKMLAEYPKTAKFRDELWERARDNPLVVTNSFGRRLLCFSRSKYGDAGERYAKHDPFKKYWCSCGECAPRRDRWKYAIAFLGRSAAFDALLRKMATIWYEKRLDQYSLPMLEVHDELDYSVPLDKVEYYATIAKEYFESPIPELGGICLPASAVFGRSWAEAH